MTCAVAPTTLPSDFSRAFHACEKFLGFPNLLCCPFMHLSMDFVLFYVCELCCDRLLVHGYFTVAGNLLHILPRLRRYPLRGH